MSVESLYLSETQSATTFASDALSEKKSESTFSQWFANELTTANGQLHTADADLRALAMGTTDNIHHVMLALSKATTSLELIVEVRNRLVEGYQEIMRMQI